MSESELKKDSARITAEESPISDPGRPLRKTLARQQAFLESLMTMFGNTSPDAVRDNCRSIDV